MDRFKRIVLLRVDKRKREKEAFPSFSPLALSGILYSILQLKIETRILIKENKDCMEWTGSKGLFY